MKGISPPPYYPPAGAMWIWLTDTPPPGWLLCYGQEISRVDYIRLFTLIGTTFGVGNGTTTFNLPDLRGRLPLGKDNMGGVSANRVTNAQADIIGGSEGAENHTLTIAEMPAHYHKIEIGSADGSDNARTGQTKIRDDNTTSAGSGNAHNNVQPYLTTNYIIKY